ncbi:MAG: hypothetical protein V1835_03295 [Candidatus Micrarchaeota archaeon]
MAKWKDLIPANEEIIVASNGSFGEPAKPQMGMLVLAAKKIYVIYFEGLMANIPKLYRTIQLVKVQNAQITGDVMRSLEFDYDVKERNEHVKFTSLDYEVRKLLEEIEYAADNP